MKKSITILSKNLYFRFLMLIFFISFADNAFSQNKDEASQKREIEKQDAKLKELSQKFAKEYQERQAQVKAYCEKNKIPMSETRNGVY
ncbi:MAG: hypothetical protein EAZ97_08010 [Bacteroidetes bacterium]|nr:MAG: hypothetical protein EAZ97_08010 [Bacteroidota bacterium]